MNPCYYGEINKTNKNDETIFLISGDGTKNFNIVADCVRNLIKNNITNFKVYVTGRYIHKELSEDIKSHIEFLGYVSFGELYSLVEKADFIIPCLDPSNKKHLWYLENGTTGAFQLSYGFCKPMIVAEKFATKALVDNKSSIIYTNNQDLYSAINNACSMNNEEYILMQQKLNEITQKLYNASLRNLQEIINKQGVLL